MVTIILIDLDIFIFLWSKGKVICTKRNIFRYIRILFTTRDIFLRTQNRFFEHEYFLLSNEERYSYTTKRTCFRKLVCELRTEYSLYIFVSRLVRLDHCYDILDVREYIFLVV